MLQRHLGDVTVRRIVESDEPNFDPLAFFPQTQPGDWDPYKRWLQPHPLSPVLGYLTLVIQSFLVRTPHHTILIDTCVGDGKRRGGGIIPKSWNQMPLNQLIDSVLSVVEAGQAVLVSTDYALDDNVWLEPTPGHTPDHFSVRLASNGNSAVVTGDVIHSPVQCMQPYWRPVADFDPALATRTRRLFLEQHCDENTLICATHFPSPSFGHLRRHADAFEFIPDA